VFLNFGGKTINKFFLNPPLDEKKKLIFDFSPNKKIRQKSPSIMGLDGLE